MELDQRQTLVIAILVLFLGRWLNRRFAPLRNWNIPEPVTGGLVAGGVLGGPLAHNPVSRYRLAPKAEAPLTVGSSFAEESRLKLDATGIFNSLLVIAIGLGGRLNELLAGWGLKLPAFVTALFAGIVLSNTIPHLFPKLHWPTGSPPLALVAEISLGLFLAMSLMSLQLWTLLDVAGPLLGILAAQIAVGWCLMRYVVFRIVGGDYDAAVTAAGMLGLSLGATPTAIAIMMAVTKMHGASPRSFIVVPLVGAFFIDIANAITLQAFVALLSG